MDAKFSASRISELLAGGQGKTANNYILDLALQTIGIKDDISTAPMKHGIANQVNAFDKVVKPLFSGAEWHDEYIRINDYCGASPDILNNGCPMDIKCPYTIDQYLEQINQPPKKYYQQVQMQMLACKADTGHLVYYLTKPEEWGEDEWTEYPFPLELRFKIFEYKKDEELHDTILQKVEESEPKKQQLVRLLLDAEIMNEELFFFKQLDGFAYRKIKDCSNIFNIEKLIRVKNNFYYSLDKSK